MSLGFTYMGTKRQIASEVAEIISRAPAGPLLDAFSGMSSVGTAVATARSVWCNDIQFFAYSVARAYFTARSQPKLSPAAVSECRSQFEKNREALHRSFATPLALERHAYASSKLEAIHRISKYLLAQSGSPKANETRAAYQRGQRHTPYCLFSTAYAGGYVGLEQAIDIDSLRFAIDSLARQAMINSDTYRWMLVALCRALGRVSNSTGHFAQFLTVKRHTKQRFLAKRRRSIWLEWQSALDGMHPLGTREWRRSNNVFQREAVQLINELARNKAHPAVVYCDPPYTKDHYSRYYHLVETLLLYDYPKLECKGQYRIDRFSSPFSVKTQVRQAFCQLIDAAVQLRSTLVLSYPDNGLIENPRDTLLQFLRERFFKAEVAAELVHEHSTLGASKGVERSPVTELIFCAQRT